MIDNFNWPVQRQDIKRFADDITNKTILFITHDFDEALRLADRIAIMKDGLIEQLDTPANIVLNPKTEYVRKFTEEVPRAPSRTLTPPKRHIVPFKKTFHPTY